MRFENEYKSTRNGFSHTSRLISETNEVIAVEKCNYLNRTWESYPFQTSMKRAVESAIENEIQRQKRLQGIKRLTSEKRGDIIYYSSLINQLKSLYKTL